MKITDYGLWFRESLSAPFSEDNSSYTTTPKELGFCRMYLCGKYVGYREEKGALQGCFIIWLKELRKPGFRINPKSPGKKTDHWWDFPPNYIPAESDFEEIR